MSAPQRCPVREFATLCALCVAACGEPATAEQAPTELIVFAASSLADVFPELERGFEKERPEIDVRLSFAGSQVLRLQLEQGARADVFASANETHAAALQAAGVIGPARPFAHNELVIIVPATSTIATTFEDLPEAPRVVLGRPDVPIGAYARQVLQRARTERGAAFASRIEEHVVSEEHNVRLVRAKIELGEADAAIVYRTDTLGTDGVRVIPIPAPLNVQATDVAAVVRGSNNSEAATAFVDYLHAPSAQRTLAEHGFLGTDSGVRQPSQ